MSNARSKPAVLLMLLLVACGKNESSATGLIRDVAASARTKPRVQVMIKASGEEATPQDLELLRSIEERIERAHIGRLISSGSAAGYLNLTVEVENTADAIAQLRSALQSAGVLERSSFKVSMGDEQ